MVTRSRERKKLEEMTQNTGPRPQEDDSNGRSLTSSHQPQKWEGGTRREKTTREETARRGMLRKLNPIKGQDQPYHALGG